MSSSNPLKYVAAGAAAVVVAVGAYAIGHSNSNSSSGTSATPAAQIGPSGSGAGQAPQSGQLPPGFGTPASGAEATKAVAAATARYKGEVERVDKLSDGSYVVHVITSNGEYHVRVSKAFKVTGSDQGGPGRSGRGGSTGTGNNA